MKLMSYNILSGGQERLNIIIEVIKKETPDLVIINEANDFLLNDGEILKHFFESIELPYYAVAQTERGYDVIIFSKFILKNPETIMAGKRAAISVEIDTQYGPVSIVGLHLNSKSELLRLEEIKEIISFQKRYENKIIIGDMNALSAEDNYNPDIINLFNDKQKQKFTNGGKLCFDVINEVLNCGYFDAAVELKSNDIYTVPTASNTDIAHSNLRLDYIFISKSLRNNLIKCDVIKNDMTDVASDHYPICVILK